MALLKALYSLSVSWHCLFYIARLLLHPNNQYISYRNVIIVSVVFWRVSITGLAFTRSTLYGELKDTSCTIFTLPSTELVSPAVFNVTCELCTGISCRFFSVVARKQTDGRLDRRHLVLALRACFDWVLSPWLNTRRRKHHNPATSPHPHVCLCALENTKISNRHSTFLEFFQNDHHPSHGNNLLAESNSKDSSNCCQPIVRGVLACGIKGINTQQFFTMFCNILLYMTSPLQHNDIACWSHVHLMNGAIALKKINETKYDSVQPMQKNKYHNADKLTQKT